DTWTATRLSDNDYLDRSPRIAAGIDDTALAVWIFNDSDDILGSGTSTSEIHYSMWDGASWSEPNTVATGIGTIVKTTLDYNGTEAAYVYTMDQDANMVTDYDHELYTVTFNRGTGWSEPVRLTNDGVQDTNPQVKLTGEESLLVWYRDPNIVSVANLNLSNIQAVIVTSQSSGVSDFRLARSDTGQVSLVWPDASAQGVDIWATMYDPVLSVWGNTYQLTGDHDMEHSLSPAFDADGNLNIAYNEVNIYNNDGIPEPNGVDLRLLQHEIGGDLAVAGADISLSAANPLPGTNVDITARVRNLGDTAAENIDVEFYQGDPIGSGVLIDSTSIVGPLAAADTMAASVSWVVPEVSQPTEIFVVVDPDSLIEDQDRNNNIASSLQLMPDLIVAEAYSQKIGPKRRTITARITNQGPVPVSNVPVSMRLETPQGAPLASFNISALDPNSYQDISFMWDMTGQKYSRSEIPVYAVVDFHDNIDEYDEDNNNLAVQVRIKSIIADFDDDEKIGLPDFAIFVSEWLLTQELSVDIYPSGGGDGIVNLLDYAEFTKFWLKRIY
ncbi:MAG: hypothetical protein GY869_25055, partial [Planctomycetes bacterium]|nr:hypothetical protein [Planctomycetota bacterium]